MGAQGGPWGLCNAAGLDGEVAAYLSLHLQSFDGAKEASAVEEGGALALRTNLLEKSIDRRG